MKIQSNVAPARRGRGQNLNGVPVETQAPMRPKNVSDLGRCLFSSGPESVLRALTSYKHKNGNWRIQKQHEGEEAWRTDVSSESTGTDYVDFSPPPLWGASYSVMR